MICNALFAYRTHHRQQPSFLPLRTFLQTSLVRWGTPEPDTIATSPLPFDLFPLFRPDECIFERFRESDAMIRALADAMAIVIVDVITPLVATTDEGAGLVRLNESHAAGNSWTFRRGGIKSFPIAGVRAATCFI